VLTLARLLARTASLAASSDQLAGGFTDIFNRSLSQSVVHTCIGYIVNVPKKAKITELNVVIYFTFI
jgi:hypothetical protein